MSDPKKIRNWFDRALELAAQVREARDAFNEMKAEDKDKQIDWASLKALAVARDADLHDEKSRGRVKKLLAKRTYASWYADINGIGQDEQNCTIRSSSEISDRPAPSDKPRDRALGTAAGTTHRAAVSIDGGEVEGEGAATRDLIPAAPSGDRYNEIPDFLRRPLVA